MNRSTVVIVGGGLSGLYAAYLLEKRGVHDYVLLEARPRLGGRLTTESAGNARFDLGATWYWPEMQPQLDAVVRELGIATFHQHEAGSVVVEQTATTPVRRFEALPGASPPSLRFDGGMTTLVDAFAARVPRAKVHLGHFVRRITQDGEFDTTVESAADDGTIFSVRTRHVLLAVPPRLVANRIKFSPPLPSALAREWADCPTWMAPHAKYVAVFERPFWRGQGLSGSGRSYTGPMVEIHDASPVEGEGAIFGFIGVPALTRRRLPAEFLISLCRAQMGRLFGADALLPKAEWLKDWSQDEFTATSADSEGASGHANGPPPTAVADRWQGRFTGIASEWSEKFPGYVAGAIDAPTRGLALMWERLAPKTAGQP